MRLTKSHDVLSIKLRAYYRYPSIQICMIASCTVIYYYTYILYGQHQNKNILCNIIECIWPKSEREVETGIMFTSLFLAVADRMAACQEYTFCKKTHAV